MLQKFIACLIGAGFMLAGGGAAAKEYAAEIIVFDRPAEKADTDEQWDFSSAHIAERLAKMTALADKVSKHETSDELVTLESMRLNLIESGYRILNTTRWQQPTSFYQNAPMIALGDPETALPAGFVRIYTTSLIYADLFLQLSPPLPETVDPVLGEIVEVADENTDDDSDGDTDKDLSTEPKQPHYFIAEKRRLKFKQVHYFDHPLFGAILGVWEVES